ncbi:hypothetical protein GOP47_0011262 [Adiantum capillus-veneris]|uniref:Uncharacterized protein n=1 Tax=Adiantum capillus-veneris TaxID=13818 RepID=A0A9D4USF8_ADICA|nr:hypothetical protein GOP47_0011262 [Adiantum capillus-veneris]
MLSKGSLRKSGLFLVQVLATRFRANCIVLYSILELGTLRGDHVSWGAELKEQSLTNLIELQAATLLVVCLQPALGVALHLKRSEHEAV